MFYALKHFNILIRVIKMGEIEEIFSTEDDAKDINDVLIILMILKSTQEDL